MQLFYNILGRDYFLKDGLIKLHCIKVGSKFNRLSILLKLAVSN